MSNREHLYRGFAPGENGSETVYIDGKEIWGWWMYGSLVTIDDPPTIWSDNHVATPVIPETVGEWTGLEDQEGNRIFEDDICVDDDFRFIVKFGNCGAKTQPYENGYMGYYMAPANKYTVDYMRYGTRDDILYWVGSCCMATVIGNRWESPELLEV